MFSEDDNLKLTTLEGDQVIKGAIHNPEAEERNGKIQIEQEATVRMSDNLNYLEGTWVMEVETIEER